MTEKKKPTFGALGNPYGMSVPDEIADFFGTEAPAAEPAVEWTEDREAAAREAAAREAASREAAAKEAAAREAAAREAAAKEAAAKEAAAKEAAAKEAAAREAAAKSAARVSAERPAAAVRPAVDEPKSFAQTIRSHWDTLIDTLGIGGRAKSERSQPVEAPVETPVEVVPAASRSGRVQKPAGVEEQGSSGRTRGKLSETRAADSGPAKAERRPRSAAPASVESPQPPVEIPADAFGFGIFSAPAAARSNPLDDLFVAGTQDPPELQSGGGLAGDSDEDGAVEGDVRRRRRRRGSRGAGHTIDSQEAEELSPVVDSRRRVPGRTEPVVVEAYEEPSESDDHIEFEVVDLAGGDLSGFWDESVESVPKRRQRPVADALEASEPPRRSESGSGRGKPGRSSARPASAARELDEPLDVEPLDAEPPRRGSRSTPSRPAPPQRSAAGREEPRPARAARDLPARDLPARDLPSRDVSSRELPSRERVGRESVGSSRGLEDDVADGGRGRSRRSKPMRELEPDMDRELDLPVDRPAASGSRRAAGNRRPVPPTPPRVEDDDDGYTVDNSWSPDDPRDEGAPKRRPVPAWRRVVDHIVDRNLSNRRGSDGGRRRGSSSGGGRGSHASVAAQPRVRRDQVPTYLDEPEDPMEVDPFDVPETPSRGRAPRRGRASEEGRGYESRGPETSSGGGRRPAERDDLPEDRPRGRRRY